MSLLISIYSKMYKRYSMMLDDDHMMIKMMTRMTTIIVASLASLTAVMMTFNVTSSASATLPNKR